MARFNLKKIEIYVPAYQTNATIVIDENHASGTPHLQATYQTGDHNNCSAAIPADWTDRDLAELISLTQKPPSRRDWPAWEVPANDYGAFILFRWWKGERPPQPGPTDK